MRRWRFEGGGASARREAHARNGYCQPVATDLERNRIIAMGTIDNLGKGAAGQAVQNANLICGLPETTGLDGLPVWT